MDNILMDVGEAINQLESEGIDVSSKHESQKRLHETESDIELSSSDESLTSHGSTTVKSAGNASENERVAFCHILPKL